MERKYKNPRIEEVLCEMQFLMPEGKGDLTYAGIIYEKIKESFPEKDAIVGVGFPLPQQRYFELPKTPPSLSISVVSRFFTSDKSTALEVSNDLIRVRKFKPYISWSNFKSLIRESFKIYRDVMNPGRFKRILLGYVNGFEFKEKTINLADYFNLPFNPQSLPFPYDAFNIRIECPCEDGSEKLGLTFATLVPTEPGRLAIGLFIEYFTASQGAPIPFDNVDEWLEKAHREIEETFETVITDTTRKLLGEGGEL